MTSKQKYSRHFEENAQIFANSDRVFTYADDFNNFSSHMNKSSWMMGGGKMETKVDEGKGQKIGSHITMTGNIFGFDLFLDEVVIIHDTPYHKEWQTVGDINLLVIDHYTLGFKIASKASVSELTVYIDYNLPDSPKTYLLGLLLGDMYAKWCVSQMINGIKKHFK